MEGQPGSALRRKQLERAKTAIRKLEAAGELIIEDTRHGPLLLPPAGAQPDNDGRRPDRRYLSRTPSLAVTETPRNAYEHCVPAAPYPYLYRGGGGERSGTAP